jgi:nucleoside permease NupC
VNGESIIMSISENDALWNNSTKQELAEKYKTLINTAIIKYKNETSVTTLAKEIGGLTGTDYHVCINFVFKKVISGLLKSNCKRESASTE